MKKIEDTQKRRLVEFAGGTVAAAIYFILWIVKTDDCFTWQMAVVSAIFGLFTLFVHWLMGKGKVGKWIACILMVAADVMALMWLVFVYTFSLHY